RDLNIDYADIGAGRPVLVIHGNPSNRHVFEAFYEPQFEGREGWRRLYPELLNFGDITPPNWMHGLDSLVDLVVEFMDAVAPGERFVVAGASWGAYLARAVVQRRLRQIDGVLIEVPMMGDGLPEYAPPTQEAFLRNPDFAAMMREFVTMLSPG